MEHNVGKFGFALLLFGIILSNLYASPNAEVWLAYAGLFFGFIGVVAVGVSCAQSHANKTHFENDGSENNNVNENE